MTALPIVETQAGDVSAYIPTNIISITDGQIYLESDLFFSGQRPAINIGLSVSRVGGDAQSKAMKKAVGSLRLELAQYKEMEVFMQFASELDDNTKKQLAFGQGLMYLLRQAKHKPLRQAEQVVLLVTALSRLMQDIPLKEIEDLKEGLLAYFRDNAPHIYQEINQSGELKEDLKESILLVSQEYLSKARQVQIRDA
jgi:F-type H+-transporting ATPase subunit alpha